LWLRYTALLWRGSEEVGIDKVWSPIPEKRKIELDELKEKSNPDAWIIWSGLTEEEKNCYRFTRSGFEILEQAFIATKKGWVDDKEIQNKWKHWAISWKETNSFAPYVLAETKHWFMPSFLEYFNSIK